MLDFNAGKYAPYVWPAYAITLAVFLAMVLGVLMNARRWRRAVLALEARSGEAP
jgi:heme exporter protein D